MTPAQCVKSFESPSLGGPVLSFLLGAAAEAPEEAWRALGLPAEGAGAALWPALTASPRALARLSGAFAMASPGGEAGWLADFLAIDFSSLAARLLLLPPRGLLALGHYAGLTLYCREAAALLRREEALALREAFGPAARDFAVRRAPFLLREPGRLAEILAGAMKGAGVGELINQVNRAGRAALAASGVTLAPTLARLFLAKLPPPQGGGGPAAAPPSLDEGARYSLEALLKKLLAKEAELKPWAAFS